MCGRFTLRTPPHRLAEAFAVAEAPNLAARYNIAPTQSILAVRLDKGGRRFAALRWGLVPAWAKDRAIGARMINARAETLAEKPAFRGLLRRRRCLIAADGFYEWQAVAGGPKQPWFIHRADDAPFAFAGLWDRWQGAGETIESATIVTTEANRMLAPIHPRMPVILPEAAYAPWLGEGRAEVAVLRSLLRPAPEAALVAEPVGRRVNDVRNDDPACIARAAANPVATADDAGGPGDEPVDNS